MVKAAPRRYTGEGLLYAIMLPMTLHNVAAVVVNYNADDREKLLAWLRDTMADNTDTSVQNFARDIYMRMIVPPASDLPAGRTYLAETQAFTNQVAATGHDAGDYAKSPYDGAPTIAGDYVADPNCHTCNTSTHTCPGCGEPVSHGTVVCAECAKA